MIKRMLIKGELRMRRLIKSIWAESEYKESIVCWLRIIGLITLIGYVLVVLYIWISANLRGFEYFSAGEPILILKYAEWAVGFLGLFVAVDYLNKEIKRKKS